MGKTLKEKLFKRFVYALSKIGFVTKDFLETCRECASRKKITK